MGNRTFSTEDKRFSVRFASAADVPLIFVLIKELAEYEKMLDEVVATEQLLREEIFEKQKAGVLIGEYDGEPVGFALFFYNFSTFLGRSGIYLEDIYIKPHMRSRGFGKIMLGLVAKIAIERRCGRLELSCLDWNQPSIEFYLSLGAEAMSEWTVYRISGESLTLLANGR